MTPARFALLLSALALLATPAISTRTARATTIAPLTSVPCSADAHLAAPHFSASTLRQGRFAYRLATGKDTSTFTLEIRRRADGTWRFTGDGSGQHWEAISDSAFRPRSSELSMQRHGHPYGFQLRYAGDSVFALVTKYDSASGPIKERISTEMHGTTIDQRIDWASLMASDLAIGQSAAYSVYDPATGSSQLTASASDGPTLESPGGPRATVKLDYTICKAGESESYTVFATKESPRMMLRENLRGSIVAKLVRIEP